MLKLQNISSYYGESVVVKGISMEIAEGSFYGILGKNGMGKTTLLKTMMGLMNKIEGNISLGEKDLTKLSTSDRAKSGLSRIRPSDATLREPVGDISRPLFRG